jgi:ferric-dicitrate binding protein FerR (iron transport regulator)
MILKKISGELTAAEEAVFRAWYEADESHGRYFERASRAWEEAGAADSPDVDRMIERFDRFAARHSSRRGRMAWMRYAGAILLLLGIGGGIWLWSGGEREESPVLVVRETVPPGSARARIEFVDGRSIDLESPADTLWTGHGATIRRGQGSVSYHDEREDILPEMHTIIIPRSGEYKLELADGSHVWLNSDSRLTYPSSFAGDERVVELVGEAFFEVAPDKDKPFIVKTSLADIKVYGTSFNVSAYREDKVQRTTLLAGRVGVTAGGEEHVIRPGQQALVEARSGVQVREVDALLFCSWHKGALLFEKENLEEIMTRLSRWYDVEVVFMSDRPRALHFTGDLERYSNLDEVLRLIEMTTRVTFDIKDNQVFVK